MKKISVACLIEDDPVQVFLVSKLLELSKKVDETWIFKNGKDAHEGLKEKYEATGALPNLILLDINMPIWDGWEFLKEFRNLELPFTGKVYILTSSLSTEDFQKAEEYKLSDKYLKKPLKINELNNVFDQIERQTNQN